MTTIAPPRQHLSERVLTMSESSTLAMARLGRELAAEGHDVISLSLGEPDFDTPDYIKEAAKRALDQGFTKYTPVNGLIELRKAISQKFSRENGLDYTPEEIVVSNGAKQSIANVCLAVLNPGDEAIVLAPDWVSYFAQIELAGATPVAIRATIDADFKVSPAQLAAAITERTRFIIFSSPCNPTGSVYTRAELLALSAVLEEHPDVLVLSDEIYEHIHFGEEHVSFAALPGMYERTVTINGFAKGYAMTGWRLGYIGAPLWLAQACTKVQGQITSGANSFAQRAAADALEGDQTPTREMRDAFLRRRDIMVGLINDIPGFRANTPTAPFISSPT